MNMHVANAGLGLNDPSVKHTLGELHRAARGDAFVFLRGLPSMALATVSGRRSFDAIAPRLKDAYIPVGHDVGQLLYNTARAIDARRIVEFGTSFGVSTIYLAAAVRDNGGGRVFGSELELNKINAARDNLRKAGLDAFAEVRAGDAQKTLSDVEGPIDLLLLDGWKDLYIPILKTIAPKLRRGAAVFADNINLFKKTLRPYVAYMQDPANGFVTTTLSLGSGLEYSVFVGANGGR